MNPWDQLSQYFDTHKDAAEINPGAADNVLIAWPSVLKGIEIEQKNGAGLKALDYGCGGGSFAFELKKRAYQVAACDSAPAMIEVARKNLGDEIAFYVADYDGVRSLKEAPFDLITGIMVFQFVEDIEACMESLAAVLNPSGILALAVFNPGYVARNHSAGKLFDGFENPGTPTKGFMCIGDTIRIPVFMRTEEEYDAVAKRIGLQRTYSDKPAFTPSFLGRYPTGTDTSEPEYLVMAYKKI